MRKTREKRSTFSLSGWLFADLLLGLTMVFFLANSRGIPAPPAVTAAPTSAPTHTPTSIPAYTPTPDPTPEDTLTASPMPTATTTPDPTPEDTLTPSPTPTATPTPDPAGPTKTPTPVEIGISQNPICYNITVDRNILLDPDSPEHAQELSSIRATLKDMLPNRRAVRVGFVFVWGHGDTTRQGVEIATKVRDEIIREFPQSFGGAASKPLFSDIIANRIRGEVQIELNLFSDSQWNTGKESACDMVGG